MKRALITGIAGQDGSYLAEYLLGLGYQVFGLVRRDPELIPNALPLLGKVEFLYGDMVDEMSLVSAIQRSWPDEVYNLAGQVFVPTSWLKPAETFDVNTGGLARLLRVLEEMKTDARVYQASTSEMYGNIDGPCDEDTVMAPNSPYGTSKLAAHELCRVYQDRGLFVVSGICFNHESPRRGPEMVTRKITRTVANWTVHGFKEKIRLGNLHACRDWGYAGDYVKAMHLSLQQEEPDDYVIGTGVAHSVQDFLLNSLLAAELIEPAVDTDVIHDFVSVDERLVRKTEIHKLVAHPKKAREVLGWQPTVDFAELVTMMVEADIQKLQEADRDAG